MNDRMSKLAANIPADHDAILITGRVNRQYYSELASSAGTLLITREKAYFIIDFRYIQAARETIVGAEIILETKLSEQLGELVKKHGIKTMGIESSYMDVERFLAIQAMLPGVKLMFDNATNNVIITQRRTKDEAEIAKMIEVQKIADKSLLELMDFIKPGKTEIQVANRLEELFKINGANGPSFSTISVAGANSAKPHGVPSENKLKDGDFLTLDFGAIKGGYVSDTTRTFAIGHATDEMAMVYNTVLKAQLAAMEIIKAGVVCNKIDAAARDLIAAAGYGDCFGHGLGHSLGLEVHENPRFNTTCTDLAEVGNVMSVEPGIYIEGKFGVRIEDVVCVTADGFINFTKLPKELTILK